ncbi:MAG: GH25 family lysozyme [Oscillospiraceae bacterium]
MIARKVRRIRAAGRNKLMIYGIDVSRHNGKIHWEKVRKSGKSFAFIRAGWSGYDGEIHLDERFNENMAGASAAGLKIGIYIYAYNKNPTSSKKTAEEILKIIKENNYKIDFPIAFDVEQVEDKCLLAQGKSALSDTCISFFEAIKQGGFVPILYSYTSFLKCYLDMSKLSTYDCWVADYREPSGVKCPYDGSYTIWQYRGENGRCDGVNGGCDLNICYKDYGKKSEEVDYKKLYFEMRSGIENILTEL